MECKHELSHESMEPVGFANTPSESLSSAEFQGKCEKCGAGCVVVMRVEYIEWLDEYL